MDGIQKYHSIDGLQRMLLLFFGDLVCNPADRAARDKNAVDVLDGSIDVPVIISLVYMDRIFPSIS